MQVKIQSFQVWIALLNKFESVYKCLKGLLNTSIGAAGNGKFKRNTLNYYNNLGMRELSFFILLGFKYLGTNFSIKEWKSQRNVKNLRSSC